jgi:hypothetical protein
MLSVFRPPFEVAKEGRISYFQILTPRFWIILVNSGTFFWDSKREMTAIDDLSIKVF